MKRRYSERARELARGYTKLQLAERVVGLSAEVREARAEGRACSPQRIDALEKYNRTMARELEHLRSLGTSESLRAECAAKQKRIEELETERAVHYRHAAEEARAKIAESGAPAPQSKAEAMSIISDLSTALMNLSCKVP
jgi:hypothetical protein